MEGLNTLVAGLEMLNAQGFNSKFWLILPGKSSPNYFADAGFDSLRYPEVPAFNRFISRGSGAHTII